MNIREYPDFPLIGVGAVVFNDENQILLVKRGNDPSKGLWAFPGGLIEVGEKAISAVKREVLEECNIEIGVDEIADVFDIIIEDRNGLIKYHYIILDYFATYIKGELQAGDDVSDAQWFFYEDLSNLDIPEMTRKLIDKAAGKLKA